MLHASLGRYFDRASVHSRCIEIHLEIAEKSQVRN